jgi:hypothetical protein
LEKLKDQKPRFFVVWTSVYGADNRQLAEEGAGILNDPRVKNYYEPKPDVVMAFGNLVPLPRDAPLAYDVYFLYDKNAEWGNSLPKPDDWWHQIIDDKRFLDGKKMKAKIEALLRKVNHL